MDLISIGKEAILEAMKTLESSPSEAIKFKGLTKNIQTKADLQAEEAIINVLKKSGGNFSVFAEEGGATEIGNNPEIEVYIDPLDGSSFFLRGHKRFCCSAMMFVKEGNVLASFVGDLMTKDIYYCNEEFSYLNNNKIFFSPEKKGEKYEVAIYATNGRAIKEKLPKLIDLAQEKILVYNNSGPLEQSFVATGQHDAVIDPVPIDLWEYCGAAIAQRAGATFTTAEGDPFKYKNIKQTGITARNPEIYKMILEALNR